MAATDIFIFIEFSRLSSLCITFKLPVGYPNRQRPHCTPKVLPPNLVVTVALALWSGFLLLHSDPDWPPSTWLQHYGVLHQIGWWACPSLFHFGSGFPLLCWFSMAPPEWPYLFRVSTSSLRFFTSPYRFFIAVCSALLSASLVERQLVYSATFYVSMIFAVFRLVTVAPSSAVAYARFSKSMEISVALFAPSALLYSPW